MSIGLVIFSFHPFRSTYTSICKSQTTYSKRSSQNLGTNAYPYRDMRFPILRRYNLRLEVMLERLRFGVARLSATNAVPHFRSSYTLLPTSDGSQGPTKQKSRRPTALVLLIVVFLLVIGGIGAGLVLRDPSSQGQ